MDRKMHLSLSSRHYGKRSRHWRASTNSLLHWVALTVSINLKSWIPKPFRGLFNPYRRMSRSVMTACVSSLILKIADTDIPLSIVRIVVRDSRLSKISPMTDLKPRWRDLNYVLIALVNIATRQIEDSMPSRWLARFVDRKFGGRA